MRLGSLLWDACTMTTVFKANFTNKTSGMQPLLVVSIVDHQIQISNQNSKGTGEYSLLYRET
jgi:hypothetical protein